MPEIVLERPQVVIEIRDCVVEMAPPPGTSVAIEVTGQMVELVVADREVVEVMAPGLQGAIGPEGPVGPPGPAAQDRYLGLWDALTNTPTLVSGVGPGEPGPYYKVSHGGSTNIDGASNWVPGDEIRWDGDSWNRVPGTPSEIDGGFF